MKKERVASVSLDDTNEGQHQPLIDFLCVEQEDEAEFSGDGKREFCIRIPEIVDRILTRREKTVFEAVFFMEKTELAAGLEMNISQQAVSEAYRRACRKLREEFEKTHKENDKK